MGRKPGATVDEKRKIVVLECKGLNVIEIAKKLNRSRPFIPQWGKPYGADDISVF